MSYEKHPLDYASCFVANSIKSYDSKCKLSGLTIIGLAKLLAYGDFLKARAAQINESILEVLDKEIAKYPYSRKSEPKVYLHTNMILKIVELCN